MGKQTR